MRLCYSSWSQEVSDLSSWISCWIGFRGIVPCFSERSEGCTFYCFMFCLRIKKDKMFCNTYIKFLFFNLLHFPADYIIPIFLLFELKYFQENASETQSASAVMITYHIMRRGEQQRRDPKTTGNEDVLCFYWEPKRVRPGGIHLQLSQKILSFSDVPPK